MSSKPFNKPDVLKDSLHERDTNMQRCISTNEQPAVNIRACTTTFINLYFSHF